jgi:hypothetical protein
VLTLREPLLSRQSPIIGRTVDHPMLLDKLLPDVYFFAPGLVVILITGLLGTSDLWTQTISFAKLSLSQAKPFAKPHD